MKPVYPYIGEELLKLDEETEEGWLVVLREPTCEDSISLRGQEGGVYCTAGYH